jgi:hypothetical protein
MQTHEELLADDEDDPETGIYTNEDESDYYEIVDEDAIN